MNGPVDRTGSEEKLNAYSILSYLYGSLMTFVCHCQCVYSQNLTQLCHQWRFCRLFSQFSGWMENDLMVANEMLASIWSAMQSHSVSLWSKSPFLIKRLVTHLTDGPKEVELHMMVIFTFWWACFTSQRVPSYLKCLNLPSHCWFYMGRGALYMHRNCQYGQHF
jgi:hypothetical protein